MAVSGTEKVIRDSAGDTRLSRLVFFLLLALPMGAAILFGAVDSPALGLLAASLCLVGVLWIADGMGSQTLSFSRNPLQLPLIGIVVIAAIQLLPLGGPALPAELGALDAADTLTQDPFATRLFLVRVLASLLFFSAALVYIRGEARVKKAVIAVVIFGAVMAFFGILQRLAAPDAIYGLRPTPQAIPFGSFVNQHHFAAFLEMTCGLTLGLALGKGVKRDKKLLLWVAAVMMALGVVFTGSRGGLISFFAVAAFSAFGSIVYRHHRSPDEPRTGFASRTGKLGAAAGAAALATVTLGLIAFLGAGEGLLRGIGSSAGADPTSGRAHFWSTAIDIFLANPVIGAGFDAFGAAYTRFDTWSGMYRLEQAHNDYLQMLTDGGLLGFACVVVFVFLLIRQGLRAIAATHDRFARSAMIGAMAGCFGILIHSFFDFPLRTTSNGLFFLLLAAIATHSAGGRR